MLLQYTKVLASKTCAELQTLLMEKAESVTLFNGEVFGSRRLIGVSFGLPDKNGNNVHFELPVRCDQILIILRRSARRSNTKAQKLKDEEQAYRIGWRQLLMYVKVVLALSELEMVDPVEAFLGFALLPGGGRLFAALEESKFKLLEAP